MDSLKAYSLDVTEGGIEPAATGTFGIRFLGQMIDLVAGFATGIVAGVVGGIIIAILARMGNVPSDWATRIQGDFLTNLLWGCAGNLIYHSLSEGIAGTSLGKLLIGYRVVMQDGTPCTPGAAFVRSLGYFVDALFFGIPAYQSMSNSSLNQRLGDKWAKTVVVQAKAVPPTARRSAGLVTIGLLVAVFGNGVCVVLSFVAKVM